MIAVGPLRVLNPEPPRCHLHEVVDLDHVTLDGGAHETIPSMTMPTNGPMSGARIHIQTGPPTSAQAMMAATRPANVPTRPWPGIQHDYLGGCHAIARPGFGRDHGLETITTRAPMRTFASDSEGVPWLGVTYQARVVRRTRSVA